MNRIKELQDRLNMYKSNLVEAKIVKLDKQIDYVKINSLENKIEKIRLELVELKNSL